MCCKKCYNCEQKTELKKIMHTEHMKKRIIFIKNVPAYYCKNCDEHFFDAKTINKIEKITDIITKNEKINGIIYQDEIISIVNYEKTI